MTIVQIEKREQLIVDLINFEVCFNMVIVQIKKKKQLVFRVQNSQRTDLSNVFFIINFFFKNDFREKRF